MSRKSLALVALSLTLPGCATTLQTQDQAGAVLASVTMVAPWEAVKESLKPNFVLPTDVALNDVLPSVASRQSASVDALALGVQAAVEVNRISQTSTTTTAADGTQATTGSSTQSRNTPSLPSAPGAPAGVQPVTPLTPESKDWMVDPMLQYSAAKSLIEYVQLLNQTVDRAALREGYTPYIVQAKLSFMPYQRQVPYDLHALVSFFADNWETKDKCGAASPNSAPNNSGPTLIEGTNSVPTSVASNNAASTDAASSSGTQGFNDCRNVFVVPILVTDNLERAAGRQSQEKSRQFGLGLSVAYGPANAGAQIAQLLQNAYAYSAEELNSKITVSAIAGNTLYARIGATLQASPSNLTNRTIFDKAHDFFKRTPEGSEYSLVGQTYDIFLLVLVPDETQQVKKIDYTVNPEFRNVTDGQRLNFRDKDKLPAEVARLMRLKPDDAVKIDKGDIKKLNVALQLNDKVSFVNKICNILKSVDPKDECDPAKPKQIWTEYGASVWTGFAHVIADNPYKTGAFMLPAKIKPRIPLQTPLLTDDGKSKAGVVLRGVVGDPAPCFDPTLVVQNCSATPPARLAATSSTLANGNLTLEFPSPAALSCGVGVTHAAKLEFAWRNANCDANSKIGSFTNFGSEGEQIQRASLTVLPFNDPNPKPAAVKPTSTVQISASSLVASSDASGVLRMGVTLVSGQSIKVELAGADVLTADLGGVPMSVGANNSVQVVKSGRLSLSLGNLSTPSVTIKTQALDGKGVAVGDPTTKDLFVTRVGKAG
jgi:hypothetical protein